MSGLLNYALFCASIGHARNTIFISNFKNVKINLLFKCSSQISATRSVLPSWRVLFFGSDEFSLTHLTKLAEKLESNTLIKKLEVVTSLKGKSNLVQKYSEKRGLKVHSWPPNLDCNEFDIGIVVSFGYLIPEDIITLFPLGMLNVHASLLPRWRGAAPIVYALMNGDVETGVTIMQIKPLKFDIGGVLRKATFPISPHITYPVLRDALACLGSEILMDCIKELPHCLKDVKNQSQEGVTYAPRISSSLSLVNWKTMSAEQVYNLWRALDGIYPLSTKWHGTKVKLFEIQLVLDDYKATVVLNSVHPGYVYYDRQTKYLKVMCSDQKWISVKNIGIPGKAPMRSIDFYNGYISKQKKDERYFD